VGGDVDVFRLKEDDFPVLCLGIKPNPNELPVAHYLRVENIIAFGPPGRIIESSTCLGAAVAHAAAKLVKERAANWIHGALDAMGPGERLEVMSRYCRFCGYTQPEKGPGCQCWNDD
jgi:hypothetical protein